MRSSASLGCWLVALVMSSLYSPTARAQECGEVAQQPSTLQQDLAFLGRLSSLTREQIAAQAAAACSSLTAALAAHEQGRAACGEASPIAVGLARTDSLAPLRRFLCLRQEGSVPALVAIGRARADRPAISDDSLTGLCAARTPQLSAFCGYSLMSSAPFPVCQALYSPDFASACSVHAQGPATLSTSGVPAQPTASLSRAKPRSAAMDSGVVFSATPR